MAASLGSPRLACFNTGTSRRAHGRGRCEDDEVDEGNAETRDRDEQDDAGGSDAWARAESDFDIVITLVSIEIACDDAPSLCLVNRATRCSLGSIHRPRCK